MAPRSTRRSVGDVPSFGPRGVQKCEDARSSDATSQGDELPEQPAGPRKPRVVQHPAGGLKRLISSDLVRLSKRAQQKAWDHQLGIFWALGRVASGWRGSRVVGVGTNENLTDDPRTTRIGARDVEGNTREGCKRAEIQDKSVENQRLVHFLQNYGERERRTVSRNQGKNQVPRSQTRGYGGQGTRLTLTVGETRSTKIFLIWGLCLRFQLAGLICMIVIHHATTSARRSPSVPSTFRNRGGNLDVVTGLPRSSIALYGDLFVSERIYCDVPVPRLGKICIVHCAGWGNWL